LCYDVSRRTKLFVYHNTNVNTLVVDLCFTPYLLFNYQLNYFVLMATPKSKGGSCCAVASCKNYSGKVQNDLELDATEYLAGWVAKKYKLQFPELGSTTTTVNSIQKTHGHDYSVPSWINRLSYGGLIIPSNDFKIKMFRVEKLYRKITKQQIPKGPGVIKNLTKKILSRMEIAKKYNPVVQTYIKQRVLIQMKYLNEHSSKLLKKRKAKSQLHKLQKLKRLMT